MKIAVLDANAFWTEELYSACARFADVLLLKPRDFRAHHQLSGRWRSDAAPRKIKDHVWEQRFSMPPGWMFSLWPLAERSIAKHIRRFAGQDSLILVVVYPQYRSIIRLLRPALSVYYNLDDYSDNWPNRASVIAGWEVETLATTDLTICIARHRQERLQARLPEKAQRIFHLPLGCTPDFISNPGRTREIPELLRKVPRPIVGHIGALNFRFDFQFLCEVAKRLPDVNFVLGGNPPTRQQGGPVWWNGYERARSLPNVHFIGWVEHRLLGDYLSAFDVQVMPYAECNFNRNACPAKLWDNIGSGRPIVANEANPETLRWREIVRIGRTPAEFAEQIRSALTRDSVEDRQRRLEIAQAHTWENLSNRLESVLEAALAERQRSLTMAPGKSLPAEDLPPVAFVSVLVFAGALLVILFEIAFEAAIVGWPLRILCWLLILASGYALLNAYAWWRNKILFRKRLDLPSSRRLMVIVPHQDDETVAAGIAMQQTIGAGGQVWVLHTTNGVTRRKFVTNREAHEQAERRQEEALKALSIAGVRPAQVTCLGFEDETALWNAGAIREAVSRVAQRMQEIQPDRVITLAYEGGHPDHDVTNYIVARAAREVGIKRTWLFEAPAYNRFFLSDPLLRRINKLLLVRFALPPRLPSDKPARFLRTSAEEQRTKAMMLSCFISQDASSLLKRFGYPDQLRLMAAYDYKAAPFAPHSSLRFRVDAFFRKDQTFPFFSASFGVAQYRALFSEVESQYERHGRAPVGVLPPRRPPTLLFRLKIFLRRVLGDRIWRFIRRTSPLSRHLLERDCQRFTGKRIWSGPFKGMFFLDEAVSGGYLPKLLGTYEKELRQFIADLEKIPLNCIVNIGASDGYYAVGLARTLPGIEILAFEAQERGQQSIQRLAEQNGVSGQVRIFGQCEVEDLRVALQNTSRVLILCDVEGFEDILLDPEKIPELQSARILVEVHDGKNPGVSARVRQRFAESHVITTIWQQRRTLEDFPISTAYTRSIAPEHLIEAVSEGRSIAIGAETGMSWFLMVPKDRS